jgi:hypothetical protein
VHAGQRAGRRGVDGDDPRVGHVGAQHAHPQLAGQVDVVDERAAAAQQAVVLQARDPRPDRARAHAGVPAGRRPRVRVAPMRPSASARPSSARRLCPGRNVPTDGSAAAIPAARGW